MRIRLYCLILLSLLFLNTPLPAGQPALQLVESVPVETRLGLEQTARTVDVWLDMINGAQLSIEMEIFYFSHKSGEALQPVVDALISAAARGVRVKILADAKMASTYPETLDELNREKNIEVRRIDLFNRKGGVVHAKYFIVDGERFFIGSQNMDWRALKHIHELGLRVDHSGLAAQLQQLFAIDWDLAESKGQFQPGSFSASGIYYSHQNPARWKDATWGELSVIPTFSPAGVFPAEWSWDETEILKLIDNAHQRLEIQLLSYNPVSHGKFYQKLDNALRKAAARGVGVWLIVSDWNTRKPGIFYLKSLQVLPNVTVKISSLPQFSGGHIPYARVEHCKYMVVDGGLVWLGTSNWSRSYFYSSRNLGVVIHNRKLNEQVHRVFQKSWESEYCRMLELEKEYPVPDIAGAEGK